MRSHLVCGVGDESVPDVDPHVFAEQAGPQEALGADAAGVRFVGHVDLLVSSQVGDGAERLRAHRAAVQLLRRVDLKVLSEAGRPRVALPTDGASVELLHAVRTAVCKHQHGKQVQDQLLPMHVYVLMHAGSSDRSVNAPRPRPRPLHRLRSYSPPSARSGRRH